MSGKILIVDDEPLIVETVSTVVKAASLIPIEAPSLEKARDLARTERPDVVLCDVNLPDGPGTTLIGYLRGLDDQIEVIMMTGGTRFEIVVEAIREGATDFLEKPFTLDQVESVVHLALTRRARRRTPAEPLTPGTALLIEGNALTLRMMGNLLAEVGVTSFQAQSFDEAQSFLAERSVDVVIADVSPDQNASNSFIHKIKALHPLLPSIVVTGSNRPEVAIEALRAGVFDVVLKPVNREEFQRAVLAARRYKVALEERTRVQRELEGFRTGIQHLQQVLDQERKERSTGASKASDVSLRVLESLPTGVVVIDREMQVSGLNRAAEQILGLTRDTVLRRSIDDVPVLAPFQQAILQTLNTGQTFSNLESEIPLGTARRAMGYGVAPLVGGEPGGVIVFFQDITTKKRLDSFLRQTDRLATLGMMVAGVTQELNSPLTIAVGYTDLLVRDAGDPARVKAQAEKIQGALRRAGEITGRLNRIVSAPSGEARPTDVRLALRNVFTLLERRLQVASLTVQLDLAPDLPEVLGDSVEFEQLFLSILMNACDATPGGGTIRAVAAPAAGGVEVLIKDTGVGIPEANLSRIFDPFFTTKDPGKGTGLGLAIAKNTVERYGGTIRAESEVGKGTTVIVRFPLPGQDSPLKSAIPMIASTGRGPKMESGFGLVALLVDLQEVLPACRTGLEAAGFKVRSYPDPSSAAASLPDDHPGAFVVDLDLQPAENLELVGQVVTRRLSSALVILGGAAARQRLQSLLGDRVWHRFLPHKAPSEQIVEAVVAARREVAATRSKG